MAHDVAPCLDSIRASWRYMDAQTATRPGSYGPLFASAPWREIEAALDTAALVGDLTAVQAQCRALWALALAYIPQQEEPSHGPE